MLKTNKKHTYKETKINQPNQTKQCQKTITWVSLVVNKFFVCFFSINIESNLNDGKDGTKANSKLMYTNV